MKSKSLILSAVFIACAILLSSCGGGGGGGGIFGTKPQVESGTIDGNLVGTWAERNDSSSPGFAIMFSGDGTYVSFGSGTSSGTYGAKDGTVTVYPTTSGYEVSNRSYKITNGTELKLELTEGSVDLIKVTFSLSL